MRPGYQSDPNPVQSNALVVEPDRRRSPRTPTLKEGRIVLLTHNSVIKCTIRNLSPEGALLVLPSVVGIPDTFQLFIDDAVHLARVVWRGTGKLGVTWER